MTLEERVRRTGVEFDAAIWSPLMAGELIERNPDYQSDHPSYPRQKAPGAVPGANPLGKGRPLQRLVDVVNKVL